jgi:hypothetical protein
MELAIPILAIGSAFILSNNKNKNDNNQPTSSSNSNGYSTWLNNKQNGPPAAAAASTKSNNLDEGYENMGNRQRLPNLNIMPDNYPVQKLLEIYKQHRLTILMF